MNTFQDRANHAIITFTISVLSGILLTGIYAAMTTAPEGLRLWVNLVSVVLLYGIGKIFRKLQPQTTKAIYAIPYLMVIGLHGVFNGNAIPLFSTLLIIACMRNIRISVQLPFLIAHLMILIGFTLQTQGGASLVTFLLSTLPFILLSQRSKRNDIKDLLHEPRWVTFLALAMSVSLIDQASNHFTFTALTVLPALYFALPSEILNKLRDITVGNKHIPLGGIHRRMTKKE